MRVQLSLLPYGPPGTYSSNIWRLWDQNNNHRPCLSNNATKVIAEDCTLVITAAGLYW